MKRKIRKRKKVKILKKRIEIILGLVSISIIGFLIFLVFNKEKNILLEENMTPPTITNVTNIPNKTKTKPFQENVSRVPEGVVLIGRGGKIKIVGE